MASPSDYVNDPRFSRTFELPADPANGRSSLFKVKYADYGYRNEAQPEQENVLLFFAPLMGSRLLHIAKDYMAKKRKIRIISPDRPGVGGTDPADPKVSMNLWREVIVGLLRHLGIRHVSVACHSGGTISALDVLLHHPEILHPERGYLAIGAPWIMPSHTSSTALAIAHSLPVSMIGCMDKLARLINNHVGPSIGFCVGASQTVVAKFARSTDHEEIEDNEGLRFEEQIWPAVMERIYAEGVRGMSSDAVLLMQKAERMAGSGWSDWGDYDTLAPRLADALRTTERTLRIDVFYAENDFLIGDAGTKGPQWFDRCWDATQCEGVIEYHHTVVKGSDHDGVWNLRLGTAQKVFEVIGQLDEADLPREVQ